MFADSEGPDCADADSKGSDKPADVQADVGLFCPHIPKDRFSNEPAYLVDDKRFFLNPYVLFAA